MVRALTEYLRDDFGAWCERAEINVPLWERSNALSTGREHGVRLFDYANRIILAATAFVATLAGCTALGHLFFATGLRWSWTFVVTNWRPLSALSLIAVVCLLACVGIVSNIRRIANLWSRIRHEGSR
jgi:hypothetical protein